MVVATAAHADAATFALLVSPASTLVPGGQVVFTATYPNDARQKIGAQQHSNPVVTVSCDFGLFQTMPMETEKKTDGVWVGTTWPIAVAVAGSCSAVLSYYNKDPRTRALIRFDIASTSFVVAG